MVRAVPLLLVLAAAGPAAAQSVAIDPAPWLGIAMRAGEQGVYVREVLPGSPAARAGLKGGDEVIAVGPTRVLAPDQLLAAVQKRRSGDKVLVRFRRGGGERAVTVELRERPAEAEILRGRALGRPLPIDLPVLQGTGAGDLAALRGQVIVIEFFATWCGPCRQTHPALVKLAAAHPQELAVRVISAEEKDVLAAYLAKHVVGVPVLHDVEGRVRDALLVTHLPTLLVLDRQGVVRFAGIGAGPNLADAVAAAERLLK